MLTESRKEKLITLCQELIKAPSYSGEEEEVTKAVKNNMQKLGFDNVKIDKYGSMIGHIKGKGTGKSILFDGHIDTVGISDRSLWSHDPFGAEIVDNKIYGRGASDMKGSVAAMIYAASCFAEDKNFKGDVYISCSVHEECFEGVAGREISEYVEPDYVVIGEATNLNLARGQRGRAEIKVETLGKTAHSSNPQIGKNAIRHMINLMQEIDNIDLNEHDVLGEGILEVTDIISNPYPGASVVPNLCKATYDRRTLVGETKESVLNQIEEEINRLKEIDEDLEARVYYAEDEEDCWTGEKIKAERFFPAWLYDKDHELVQKASTGLAQVGLNPEISHYSFCTNGSHFAGEKNIPTVGFGPSQEHLAHVIDEHIEVDQLLKGCKGFYGIMEAVLK
ncbi:YgeY family selenium metabolism-linked hydrolase [Selenihalanaerobacter shriftii]|uniref:Putative selenium metabolism hydrolase n=1 Tax=Selenihalanaerobacter shriftii TaxID=142842 RepID=A0A1T4MW94_9FIRM|nr:YgeY family selenium metabolism-linked hydrolase [Selenihalanaerobacter shriftii]SJZ71077.1 putative selenium metabolism hydrolase [Selenihalanaerobacter shriftii]